MLTLLQSFHSLWPRSHSYSICCPLLCCGPFLSMGPSILCRITQACQAGRPVLILGLHHGKNLYFVAFSSDYSQDSVSVRFLSLPPQPLTCQARAVLWIPSPVLSFPDSHIAWESLCLSGFPLHAHVHPSLSRNQTSSQSSPPPGLLYIWFWLNSGSTLPNCLGTRSGSRAKRHNEVTHGERASSHHIILWLSVLHTNASP